LNLLAKLLKGSKQRPDDTYIGLVDENGVTKGAFNDDWSLTFSLIAYSKNDAEVIESEAVVYKDIPSPDFELKGVNPLTIVKLKGEQISYHGQHRIMLQSILKTGVKHDLLLGILESRKQPIIFESARFGRFELDRRLDWFNVKTSWRGNEIRLSLSADQNEAITVENFAGQIFDDADQWEERFKRRISNELLELKNESWLEEDEAKLTEDAFLSRITLESIVVYPDKTFEAWFDDGDTFWGHAISVTCNLDGTTSDCGIHG